MSPVSSVARQQSTCSPGSRRVPGERPAAPGPRPLELAGDLRVGPGRAAVGAHLDPRDGGATGPRAALELHASGVDDPVARVEVGHARRRHQRSRAHARHRPAVLVLARPDAVARRDLVPRERLRRHGDLGQPLDVGHAVPAGNDEPEREAVLRRQRSAVHLVRENGAALECLVNRQAALVALLDVALHAAVEAAEDDVDRVGPDPCLLEQGRERHPGPPSGADRLGQPRLADRPRLEQRAAVAGALHRRGQLDPWARTKLVEAQRRRSLDRAADLEPPAWSDRRAGRRSGSAGSGARRA